MVGEGGAGPGTSCAPACVGLGGLRTIGEGLRFGGGFFVSSGGGVFFTAGGGAFFTAGGDFFSVDGGVFCTAGGGDCFTAGGDFFTAGGASTAAAVAVTLVSLTSGQQVGSTE